MGGDRDNDKDWVKVAATGPAVVVDAAEAAAGAGARMELATEGRGRVEDDEKGAWPHISSIFQ